MYYIKINRLILTIQNQKKIPHPKTTQKYKIIYLNKNSNSILDLLILSLFLFVLRKKLNNRYNMQNKNVKKN